MNSNIENAKKNAKKSINSRKNSECDPIKEKIVLITGAAQGIGAGIARELCERGAKLIIADLPFQKEQGENLAGQLGERASFCEVDVTNEESVKAMVCHAVNIFGGLDVLISNAGVARAGSLNEMNKETFDFVTAVNYTGYFLCAKYASEIMKAQSEAAPRRWHDIVQINSKSGLAGSKNNFAYSGGKFGGIGLTQSLALELAPYQIKVNAVCPGNYYDGPLWADPENGLFVQYLRAGKVPGAKSVEDVKNYYLSLSPIKRGCYPSDIAKAIIYCIDQKYETGQAIPVTGGQIMLG